MRDWGLWEWAAYGSLALSIIGDAVEQLRKRWPDVSVKFPPFFDTAAWAFLPLTLLIVGSIIFVCRELGWVGSREYLMDGKVIPQTASLKFVKTSLRLQFFGDNRLPIAVNLQNVATWYAYYSSSIQVRFQDASGKEIEDPQVPPTWAIFVSLDLPSSYQQGIISFSNPEKASQMEVRMANSRAIIATVSGQLPSGVLEVYIQE